ncbi:hypothetical protein BJ138DRAFT_1146465 [Hygrophoropsis aurantiaca]|uniref:Uncharacterized protein n=1 Tax=Hygrophoropsis aurantiaca TaxID=72124 RepID=A0ACB8AJC0_9AGAM|nr:hypothetical protein BJ138DRAFT_1146465 [Hygrophoropsis aurantiaca]
MRTFTLLIILATASISAALATPSPIKPFQPPRDDTDATHEHHTTASKNHVEDVNHSAGQHIGVPPARRDMFARVWRRNGVLGSRFIKNADYGAGDQSVVSSPTPTKEPTPPANTAPAASPKPSAA